MAPIYKDFALALRLKGENGSFVMLTDADIRQWLPGDNIYNDAVFVPADAPKGKYTLQIGIVSRSDHEPKVKLAIEGRQSDGWYNLGEIAVF